MDRDRARENLQSAVRSESQEGARPAGKERKDHRSPTIRSDEDG